MRLCLLRISEQFRCGLLTISDWLLSKEALQGTCAESSENKGKLMVPSRAAVLPVGLGYSWDPGQRVLRNGILQET